jgi:hypothetical protein
LCRPRQVKTPGSRAPSRTKEGKWDAASMSRLVSPAKALIPAPPSRSFSGLAVEIPGEARADFRLGRRGSVSRLSRQTRGLDEQQRSEPGLSALSLCARSERLARTQQGPRAARPPASAPQPLPRSPPKLGDERGVRGRTQPGRRAEGYGAQNGRRPLRGDRRRPRGNRIERRRAFEPQAAISRSCSSDRRGHLDRDRELWLAGSLAL